jgi:hypothetical protein
MRPSILTLLFVPLLASIFCWFIVFWFFWNSWMLSLTNFMQSTWIITTLQAWAGGDAVGLLMGLSILFLILLFLPLAYVTATVLTSILVMPLMIKLVVSYDYSDLEQKRGGSITGSIWNSIWISLLYLIGIVCSLPLWLIPGGAIAAPLLLAAWMNKKIFTYDSLQDYASADEFTQLIKKESRGLFGIGILLGLLAYLPLISFVLPALMGLAYTHFCLSALRRLRNAKLTA